MCIRDSSYVYGVEKQIMRETFGHLLPISVATRQKEQFSDAVSYGWVDRLKELAEEQDVDTDSELEAMFGRLPSSREQAWYMSEFSKCLPGCERAVGVTTTWKPMWNGGDQDPSGRAVSGHNASWRV